MSNIKSVVGAVSLLVSGEKEIDAVLLSQSEKNKMVLIYMAKNDVSYSDMRETFQTAKGSDWPKTGESFMGQIKAKGESLYARCFCRFYDTCKKTYEFETDEEKRQVPVLLDGEPMKAEGKGKPGSGGNTSGRTGKGKKIEGGAALWKLALEDILSHCAKLRTAGTTSVEKKNNRAAASAIAELVEDLKIELELDIAS